mgnify:CR=1 FL=1
MIENLGKGKFEHNNGDVFEGEFENFEAKHGLYTWKNGDTFEGPCEYYDGTPHGIGIYTKNG